MHEGSDGADGPSVGSGRTWPLGIIGVVIGWLVLSGGSLTDWLSLRGPVPGTGGILAKGHLVLIGLILLIVTVVRRMPREGGPIETEERPGVLAPREESGSMGEEPETESSPDG